MKKREDKVTTIKILLNTQGRFRRFVDGIGGTYNGAIQFLLDQVAEGDEDALLTGVRLRDEYQSNKEKYEPQKVQKD
jgi:hypothetical protein